MQYQSIAVEQGYEIPDTTATKLYNNAACVGTSASLEYTHVNG